MNMFWPRFSWHRGRQAKCEYGSLSNVIGALRFESSQTHDLNLDVPITLLNSTLALIHF